MDSPDQRRGPAQEHAAVLKALKAGKVESMPNDARVTARPC